MYVKSKISLIALLLLFFIPAMGAWYLYTHQDLLGKKTVNHGSLIQPPWTFDEPVKGKWLIVYIAPTPCDAECKNVLYKLQQVHKTLGKDQRRVARQQHAPSERLITGQIYLVDPLGNVFMHYPQAIAPQDLKADLVRLLKVSRIG